MPATDTGRKTASAGFLPQGRRIDVCIPYIYTWRMRIEFDPAKAKANLLKHRVSFTDAEGVFTDPLAVTIKDPDASGEQRFITIGLGSAGKLLVVVYTERGGNYRLISARPATRKEGKHHES